MPESPKSKPRAHAEALSQAFAAKLENLATKQEIKGIGNKIDLLETSLRGEMKLLKWIFGTTVTITIGTFLLVLNLVLSA